MVALIDRRLVAARRNEWAQLSGSRGATEPVVAMAGFAGRTTAIDYLENAAINYRDHAQGDAGTVVLLRTGF